MTHVLARLHLRRLWISLELSLSDFAVGARARRLRWDWDSHSCHQHAASGATDVWIYPFPGFAVHFLWWLR